jgi:hypothetical protein
MSPLTALHALLDEARVASLAVATAEGPDVSLVPVLVRRAPLAVVLLVSELSAHTAAERATVHGEARFLTRDEAAARGHDAAWSARFPRVSGMILPLKDFHFVEVTPSPRGASFVQGFGRAFCALGPALDVLEHVTGR